MSQRTHEIGIRLALGAERGQILGLVLRQGMLLLVIGCVLGVVGAALLSQVLAGLLFGVGSFDPLAFALAPAVLGGVALAACYLPARRAAGVDPLTALRYE